MIIVIRNIPVWISAVTGKENKIATMEQTAMNKLPKWNQRKQNTKIPL